MAVSYEELFHYEIRLALTCKTCGTQWVPPTKGAAYSANIETDGRQETFRAGIRIEDYRCPVCAAHESLIRGFRDSQVAARRQY